MTQLDRAISLASTFFYVFPIKADAKFPPLVKNWPLRSETADASTISRWFHQWPDANIGIHCKGLLVLDIDVRNNGDESLAALEMIYGLDTRTLTTRTPTGGRHLFYRLPEGHPGVPNGANRLGKGVDVKSTNGYVVAPGSVVEAGEYVFENDLPILDAPEWLVQKLGMSTIREQKEIVDIDDAPEDVVDRAIDWIRRQPAAVDGEGGDQRTFIVAAGLRDFGLSKAQALDVLIAEYNPRCAPPWELSDLQAKVEHAYRYAQNEPGSKAASAEDFPIVNPPPRNRPKIMRLDELAELPTATTGYLIKGMLQRRSHAVMYGKPGAGKTFVALDMAYHIAAGKPWQEHKVHQGLVLYLAYEGLGGLAKRAAALDKKYNTNVPLYIAGADYNLRDQAGRKALGEDMASLPEKPVLVIIDTLARAMKGGDENSAQDMGSLNDAVSALIEATGACVMLIHHSGKNKAGGARGSSALLGAIDTEIEVDSRQIYSRKQRDLELAPPHGFKLVPVVVGKDEDDAEVSSCIVEACVPVAERMAGLPERQRLALDCLTLMSEENEPVPMARWQGKCNEFLPERSTSARQAFVRIRNGLQSRGLIEEPKEGFVQRRLE